MHRETGYNIRQSEKTEKKNQNQNHHTIAGCLASMT